MNVKTSRAQRSRPTWSRYAEEVATSIDPNHASGRGNQSLLNQGVEDQCHISCWAAGGGRTGSLPELVDARRSWIGEHGAKHGASELASAPVIPRRRAPSRRGRRGQAAP